MAGLRNSLDSSAVWQERREAMQNLSVLEPADGAPVGRDDEAPLPLRTSNNEPGRPSRESLNFTELFLLIKTSQSGRWRSTWGLHHSFRSRKQGNKVLTRLYRLWLKYTNPNTL